MEIKVMLEQMVGQVASVNSSPTLSAKLISVGNKCVWEVTPNRYDDKNNLVYQPGLVVIVFGVFNKIGYEKIN
jgi:hypothetical protein